MKSLLFVLCYLVAALAQAEPVHIRVGATLPLSGRLAAAGEDTRRGIEMAVKDFGSELVRFEAIFEDNQHEAKLGATTAHKLLEQDNVDVIISMWDMADVVAPLAERKKVPHLSIRWDPSVAEKYRFTFTFESTYRSYADSSIELLKFLGARSAAVITEEAQGWLLASEHFERAAPAKGLSVAALERFSPLDVDYSATVLRTLAKKPGFVIIFCNPPHTQNIIRRLRELAPQQRFTGYFEVLDDFSLVEGIPFVAQFEVSSDFSRKFEKQYGNPPKSRAPQAYDILHVLALSAEKSKAKPVPESIAAVLKDKQLRHGAAGPLTLTGEKSIESSCVWKKWNKNGFSVISQDKADAL